jgi:hypothetical protein
VLILGKFYKLSWPIHKSDGHLKSDGFGFESELSPMGADLISHPVNFIASHVFAPSTRNRLIAIPNTLMV